VDGFFFSFGLGKRKEIKRTEKTESKELL